MNGKLEAGSWKRRFAIAVGCGVLAADVSGQSATFKAPVPRFPDPERRAKLAKAFPEIDKLFQDYAAGAHVPGAAWGIVIDGELAHAGVTGYRDVPSTSSNSATKGSCRWTIRRRSTSRR
jgi:hypothetical protein